ncbi:hypothetical protein [Phytohabitans rumicis]|uniref:Uncharacterized protein n=1 Tax=Phytohabitans rumicis TaxID=1076125 RepID=A0A6V8KZU3_9ACTN|nr:hypothetical protein [Phytohabitans rumicis]GFJ87839.1 hypothetical protein Prum_014810 [Phytohabitans rumicis]
MVEVPEGELLIVRFSPMSFDRLKAQAEEEADDCAARGESLVYSISTFGLVRSNVETGIDDLVIQICKEAPVSGKNIWLTTERDLSSAGLAVRRSEPPPHHYDVILGSESVEADIWKLVRLFEPNKRRNPAWRS